MGPEAVGSDGRAEEDVDVAPDAEPDARLPGKGDEHISGFLVHFTVNFTGFNIIATTFDLVDIASAEGQITVEGDDIPLPQMEISAGVQACEDRVEIARNGINIGFSLPEGQTERAPAVDADAAGDEGAAGYQAGYKNIIIHFQFLIHHTEIRLTLKRRANRKVSEGGAEEGFAGGEDVLEAALEIACVPRVCDIAAIPGAGHQQMDFALRVGRDDAADPA